MYGPNIIYDHNIVAINRADATIIVQKRKKLHTIDLNICSENFKSEHNNASENCIGDRNIEGKYFYLYTSGIKTKIYFKKFYIFNLLGNRIFVGNRTQRFLKLQDTLTQLGYSTYDLT